MHVLSRMTIPITVALLGFASAANAVVVLGAYNTGVGANGAPLATGDGVVDPHYVIVSTNNSALTVGAHALTYYNPAYLPDGSLSRIVNGTGNGAGFDGSVTTFETTFSLKGYDATKATISGQSLFDNFGTISLNGHQIGGTISGFNSLTPFGTNANFFVAGTNKLDFTLHNQGGPEAFQVAGLTVTAAPGLAVVPEPATWALMAAGFGMIGFSLRRGMKMTVVTA